MNKLKQIWNNLRHQRPHFFHSSHRLFDPGINRYRTVEHDSAFGIRQIVDMALRSLSLSINDTTTSTDKKGGNRTGRPSNKSYQRKGRTRRAAEG